MPVCLGIIPGALNSVGGPCDQVIEAASLDNLFLVLFSRKFLFH